MISLSELADWLATNPWFGILGFIAGVIGIILTIRSKKEKLPLFAIRSNNIIRDLASRFEPLQVLYSRQRVENLTVTKLAFWNGGRETINNQDIASIDPLAVYVKSGYKILDTKVLYSKNPANQFSFTTADDKSHIKLNFEYLDKNEGGVIQLLHTGKSSDDIEVRGTIKGAGKPINKSVRKIQNILSISIIPSKSLSYKKRRLVFGLTLFITPILFIFMIFSKPSPSPVADIVISIFTLILYWGMGFYLIKKITPKGFDAFEDDEYGDSTK